MTEIFRHQRVIALVFSFIAAVLWVSCFSVARFADRDAFDYAQIGRQLRQGEGFTTRQTFPRHIPYMAQRGMVDAPWPSLLRYPVLPALDAAAQTLEPDPVRASIIVSGICYLASVPLFFLLAVRLFGTGLACLATLLYLGDPNIIRNSYNGMTESPSVLLVLALLGIWFSRSSDARSLKSWVTLGVLTGVAYLTRTQLIVCVPLVLLGVVLTVPARLRRRAALVFLASALCTVSPWLVRNYLVTNDPFFAFTNTRNLLAHTAHHTGVDRFLDEPVQMTTVLADYGDEILDKIWKNFWPKVVEPAFWFKRVGWYLLLPPLAILGLAFPKKWALGDRNLRHFEAATVLFMAANFAVVCLIYHRPRYYDPLLPLLSIVCVARGAWLCRTAAPRMTSRLRNGVFVGVLAIAGVRLAAGLADHRDMAVTQRFEPATYQRVQQLTDRDDLIVSDLSAEVTLFLGNPTVRYPARPEELLVIDRDYLEVDAVLLSPTGLRQDYQRFVESSDFLAKFVPTAHLPNQAVLYQKNTTDSARARRDPGPTIHRSGQ
jgi:hypothetical protein